MDQLTLEQLLAQIANMGSANEDMDRVYYLVKDFRQQATAEQQASIDEAILRYSDKMLAQLEKQTAESIALLRQHGYTFEFDPGQWLTDKRYAKTYGIDPDTITAWIDSGVIPANCVQVIEIEGPGAIRLIKDQPYT